MADHAYDIGSIRTVEDFADWAERQKYKYEFIDGRIIMQAGVAKPHGRLQTRLITAFENRLRRSSCEVYGSDSLISTKSDQRTGRLPDVTVRCGPDESGSDRVIHDPVILVEILSPSTAEVDRGEKLQEYTSMASLRHYLIFDATRVHVEHHARGEDGWACNVIENPGATLVLDPPGVEVPLAEVYEGIA